MGHQTCLVVFALFGEVVAFVLANIVYWVFVYVVRDLLTLLRYVKFVCSLFTIVLSHYVEQQQLYTKSFSFIIINNHHIALHIYNKIHC